MLKLKKNNSGAKRLKRLLGDSNHVSLVSRWRMPFPTRSSRWREETWLEWVRECYVYPVVWGGPSYVTGVCNSRTRTRCKGKRAKYVLKKFSIEILAYVCFLERRTELPNGALPTTGETRRFCLLWRNIDEPSGFAVWGVGLWLLDGWDCGFESRRGYGYPSWVLCVVR